MTSRISPPTSAPPEADSSDWLSPTPPWLCWLSGFHLIRVSGKDALLFLNNQLTGDLNGVSDHSPQFSGYCSPKGRLYSIFRVFKRGADYYLRTPTDNAEATLARLRMFILRSEVTLEIDPALRGFGLIGPGARHLLNNAGLSIPETGSVCHAEYSVVHTPGLCQRYEIHAPHDKIDVLRKTLTPDTLATGSDVWQLHDILNGVPNIYNRTRELFVPQMVNLDLLGAVSFSKGCYPGQEVVARTHYLGKLKRRMYRFSLAHPPSQPLPGDAVFVPAYSTEQPSGEIVDICKLPDGSLTGLASLRIQGIEQGGIRLGTPNGATVQIAPLPYEITAETRTDAAVRT